ncbi:MAG: prepilin peptidase [Armatimonadetes bacterium]|nr:prepilin peptidase [Armatimonadota bacterium]
MFPAWTWIVGFGLGAAVGSFVNVVIYRLPRGLSVNRPANSFCPSCKHRLTGLDLVPLLSWVFLRGKCRHCGGRISSRYFIVELINGSIWAGVWYQQFVLVETGLLFEGSVPMGVATAYGVAYMLFASALVAAIFTDLQHYVIPDQVNAFMLLVGLGLGAALMAMGWPEAWMWGMPGAVAGALVGWAALWGIAFLGRLIFRKDAMGHGDIKMARGIGAVLLPAAALMSFGIAIVLGAVIGTVLVLVRRNRQDKDAAEDEAPYEPESLGSLAVCGLGYLLCIDVVGLAFPKLYERWFGENPYSVEDIEDEPEVELTMIPFGPYLAAGALVALLAEGWLLSLWRAYLENMGLA